MKIGVPAAEAFVATHARVLDRRRLDRLLHGSEPGGVLAALDAYRNPDGGYGWGLESDLRSAESQPAAALHAFEVFAEVAPATSPHAEGLCDWMSSHSLSDGGVPFALPTGNPAGCAPWWADADPTASSLQITSVAAAHARRVAAHDPAVAQHPWLSAATDYCIRQIAALDTEPHAYVLLFSVLFLDAVVEKVDEAPALLKGLGRFIPDDGKVYVQGGTEDEYLRPLDFAPEPDRPARELFEAELIAAELQRLAGDQQDDGGWPYEPATFSPASALEWRGYATVGALTILTRNGLLQP